MGKLIFKKVAIISLLGILGLSAQGCSIYKALSGPAPIDVERVKVGESRNIIISTLGIPKHTESKADSSRTEMYEFTDGYSNGSKARVVFYIAGDFFTLGLTELLFWPIELAAGGGTDGRAIVTYGQDDIARSVLLTKTDGSPWPFPYTQKVSVTPSTKIPSVANAR